jgi:hypothetical protein
MPANLTTALADCVIFAESARQPADRIRPLPPEQGARVTSPCPGMFAAPPITQAVWASRTAFSGGFASTATEISLDHPNRLSRCALRSDDTEAPTGVASGPMSAESALMPPHPVRR